MNNHRKMIAKVVRRFFGPEGDTVVGGQGNDTIAGSQGNQQQPPPAPVTQPRMYTEEQHNALANRLLADERRKLTEGNRKTVQQLEEVKKSQSLTQEQRDALQIQIDDLTATFRTAEETKKLELDKWQNKYDTDTKKLKIESNEWRTRFESRMISVDINRAAIENKAVSPEQIEAFLRPITRVTERLDEAGKPTGDFVTKVRFEDTDAEGKKVMLDLDTSAAVKLMSERGSRFGNLFHNATGGGTGQAPITLPLVNGRLDIERMTPAEYKKNRPAIHQQMRAAGQK